MYQASKTMQNNYIEIKGRENGNENGFEYQRNNDFTRNYESAAKILYHCELEKLGVENQSIDY